VRFFFNKLAFLKKRYDALHAECKARGFNVQYIWNETLPDDLPVVFISAVTGQGIDDLKDVLWKELNAESNKLQDITSEDTLVHRDKDMSRFAAELAAEDADIDDVEDSLVIKQGSTLGVTRNFGYLSPSTFDGLPAVTGRNTIHIVKVIALTGQFFLNIL